jgi:uroporphyrinogen-III decarboxylase
MTNPTRTATRDRPADLSSTITSRDRVLASLAHRQPDRVPLDFGGTVVSSLHVSCVAALRDYFGLEKRLVKACEPYQMLGTLDEDLKQAMGIDVEPVESLSTAFGYCNRDWKPWRMPDGLEILVSEEFRVTTDPNGDILIYPEGDLTAPPSGRMPKDGYFFDVINRQPPIVEEELNPQDNLEEFKPLSQKDIEQLRQAAARARASGRAVIMGGAGTSFGDIGQIPAPSLKHPKGIRDVAEWYMSTSSRQDYVHQVFSAQCEIGIENLKRIHQAAGDLIDVMVVSGTDFGTQTSSFCSVKTFQELYLPYCRKVGRWIHENTEWKTFAHSCGSVERFIPSFIEAGIDILNPVQCSAVGMGPEHLKATYGDRIAFWGGGVDTQHVLPFGTPQEVRKQVLERCRIFSRDGGFVFNTIHNIQARTPVPNIVAMLEAVHEFNGAAMPAD